MDSMDSMVVMTDIRWAVKHTMVDDGWWWLMANSREICQLLYTTWVIWVLGDSNDHDFFVGWHQWHQLRTFAAILSSPFSRWSRNSRPELWCYLLAFVWPVESLGAHHASISEVYLNVVSLMIQAFGDMFWTVLCIFGHFCFQHWNWMKLDHSLWYWYRRLEEIVGSHGRSKDQNRGPLRFDVCEHEPSILSHFWHSLHVWNKWVE